ncbi:esterase/lipase family protein [Haliangium sp.]|uniref:esterase/lipase family protein n=1 Tax=Haliangium sp. TaxID=2663208 RepID=UPI003D0C834E
MSRRHLSIFLITFISSAGCTAEQADLCVAAADHVGACFDTEPPAVTGECTDEEFAAEVLETPCEELSSLSFKGVSARSLLCDTLGIFCDAAPLGPAPQGSPARYPIVLAHGFNASTSLWGFHPDIVDALRADGHLVYTAEVAPYKSVADRAEDLAAEIDTALAMFGADKVNIIAHSMGGLDTRYLISSLGYGDRVASLTTISTPHRGSFVADIGMGLTNDSMDAALNALAELLARAITRDELAQDSDLRAALRDLSEAQSVEFNATQLDDPDVYYQSWAGVSNVGRIPGPFDFEQCTAEGGQWLLHDDIGAHDSFNALLLPLAAMVAHGVELRPNDGLVMVESARWGQFRGCIPADHIDEIGGLFQNTSVGTDPNTGFDPVRFYRNNVFELAALGF